MSTPRRLSAFNLRSDFVETSALELESPLQNLSDFEKLEQENGA